MAPRRLTAMVWLGCLRLRLGRLMTTRWKSRFPDRIRIRKSGFSGFPDFFHFWHVVSQIKGLGMPVRNPQKFPDFRIRMIREIQKTGKNGFFSLLACSLSNQRSWQARSKSVKISGFPELVDPDPEPPLRV